MIAIDISGQEALDADLKSIQQIKVTGNLARYENTIMFFIIEERKKTILYFLEKPSNHCNFILL